MSSSLIDFLHPKVKTQVLLWLKDCWQLELSPHIYCSQRSPEEQARLFRVNRRFVVCTCGLH